MMDQVPETWVSGFSFGSVVEKWVSRHVEQGLSAKFLAYLMILQSGARRRLVQHALKLNPFYGRFRVPDTS